MLAAGALVEKGVEGGVGAFVIFADALGAFSAAEVSGRFAAGRRTLHAVGSVKAVPFAFNSRHGFARNIRKARAGCPFLLFAAALRHGSG